ncbi:MAG TPA: NAD(P)-dependent oxidoreductase [Flavisolibacter sp.]|nr:NAD(P)-dependent oxidoreductase [Sediminibacterium sp.]HJW17890.1 NAD(P)-dependent oxidoreductase [Flavisolibacter sp.]
MLKILITGASGFVGNYLVKKLTDLGYEVVALSGKDGHIAAESTWSGLPSTDVVIHLAAKAFVPDSWSFPDVFLETNTIGTLRALEYCRKYKAKMIFISSYLYGNPKSLPIFETDPVYTPNPYALSKKTSEDYCRFYTEAYNVPTLILRPFNIYGYGQSTSFLIPLLIEQVLKQKEIHVKDLEPKRDYLHISDFIDAIVKSISFSGHDTINIGFGESYSVKEIIDKIQSICRTNYPVKADAIARQAEIMNTVAGISKAKRLLNWQPRLTLAEGLTQMIEQHKLAND